MVLSVLEEVMKVTCDKCHREFVSNHKEPIIYDHGKRYCILCYAEVCKEKMGEYSPTRENPRPFHLGLTLRISLRRFAGWWVNMRHEVCHAWKKFRY